MVPVHSKIDEKGSFELKGLGICMPWYKGKLLV
jgi:hypothetical protein